MDRKLVLYGIVLSVDVSAVIIAFILWDSPTNYPSEGCVPLECMEPHRFSFDFSFLVLGAIIFTSILIIYQLSHVEEL